MSEFNHKKCNHKILSDEPIKNFIAKCAMCGHSFDMLEKLTKSEERVKEFEERLADARKTAADFYYDECIACEIEPDEGIYEGFKGLNI